MKLRKKIAALLMCGAIGVLNCMPVCAATQGECEHSVLILSDTVKLESEIIDEDCQHCNICSHCSDQVYYEMTLKIYKCALCGETHTRLENREVDRYCMCTQCQCCG